MRYRSRLLIAVSVSALTGGFAVPGSVKAHAADRTFASAAMAFDDAIVERHRGDVRRVLDVGYRVSRALAASCPLSYSYGFAIEHRAMYAPDAAAAMGFAPDSPYPRVFGVAPGSSAETGGLRAGDVIVAAGQRDLAVKGSGFAPVEAAIDRIEDAAGDGRLTLKVWRDATARTVTFSLAPGCGGWFDVKPSGSPDAVSNLRWIQPTDALLREAPRDDDLAFVLGHEMGHRILRIRARHANRKVSRQDCGGDCEIFADSVGVAVLPCLGYDPARAFEVLRRIHRRRDVVGSFLGLYTTRMQSLQAAIVRQGRNCHTPPI